ncbi:MAG: hypothetical protein ABIA78_04085 [archaeon]
MERIPDIRKYFLAGTVMLITIGLILPKEKIPAYPQEINTTQTIPSYLHEQSEEISKTLRIMRGEEMKKDPLYRLLQKQKLTLRSARLELLCNSNTIKE